MSPSTIRCVLLDLDGVVRHFDPAAATEAEAAYRLEPGSLLAAGAEPDRMQRLVTGQITRQQWIEEIGRTVGSPPAARQWTADIGTPDPAMLALIDELRAGGLTVAILTNGTDTIPAELAELGIAERVDAVFNSAEIGAAKPDPRAFVAVCDGLGIEPAAVFFTDDGPDKLSGARELGMTAEPFTAVDELRTQLRRLGLPV